MLTHRALRSPCCAAQTHNKQFDKYQLTDYEDAGPPYVGMDLTYANEFQACAAPRRG